MPALSPRMIRPICPLLFFSWNAQANQVSLSLPHLLDSVAWLIWRLISSFPKTERRRPDWDVSDYLGRPAGSADECDDCCFSGVCVASFGTDQSIWRISTLNSTRCFWVSSLLFAVRNKGSVQVRFSFIKVQTL